MLNFENLGIDFPLFAADVSEARRWSADGTCHFCLKQRPGFEIGIGDYVSISCPTCSVETYAAADGRAGPCHRCASAVARSGDVEGEHGCWRCLRAGTWAATVDTEAGMVTPVHALVGLTHGLPFPPGPVVEHLSWPVGSPNEDGWREVSIPSNVLTELVRSPSYVTWQGASWLFHCGNAMRYLGSWGKRDFALAAESSEPAELARSAAGIEADVYAHLTEMATDSPVCVYMFGCRSCAALRGHWDCD